MRTYERAALVVSLASAALLAAVSPTDAAESHAPHGEVSLATSRSGGAVHVSVRGLPARDTDRPVLRLVALPPGAGNVRIAPDGTTPGVSIEAGAPMTLRGTPVLPLLFRPAGDAAGKGGALPSPLRFDVLFDEAPAKKGTGNAAAWSRGFYDAYAGLFSKSDRAALESNGEGTYLIVTDPDLEESLDSFVRWKEEMGFEVEVLGTDVTGTRNTDIRDYVRALYATADRPPQFLLLVGDVEQVPSWDYQQSVSDHPYALMDDEDFLPDLMVGRLSARNEIEAGTMVAKILRYEQDPYMQETDWYTRGLLVAPKNLGSTTPVPVSRWCRDQLLEIGFAGVDTVYDPPFGVTAPPVITMYIDAGVSIVSYRGWAQGSAGWESPRFTVDHVPGVDNGWMLPLVCSFVCQNNNFADDECFGEAWMRAGSAGAPKGAVAFIGNSEHWSHTRFNDAAAIGFFTALRRDDIRDLGGLLLASKVEIHDSFPDQIGWDDWGDESVEFYYHIYSLLGDPSMEIRTSVPESLTVTHADTIPLGSTYFRVAVREKDSGDVVEGARVGIAQGDEALGSAFTDATGEALFFTAFDDTTEPVRISVTGPSLFSYRESVAVVSHAVHLGYETVAVAGGDGDGIANPGESLDLTITLGNRGQANATGVRATLEATTGNASVAGDTIDFPDIAGGSSAASDSSWTVSVDSAATDGEVIRFVLVASSGSAETTNGFELAVAAPDLRYVSHDLAGDGLLDPGESAGLDITLANDGSAGAPATEALLRCDTPKLASVLDSTASFGPIAAGKGGATESAFTIAAGDSAAVGQAAVFTLVLTTGDGYAMRTSLSISIGSVDHRAPTGPDDYGYYAYDNSDTDYPEGAPLYDWIECSPAFGGEGTKLDMTDEQDVYHPEKALHVVALPFPFRFYGETYEHLLVCNNGWASFDTTHYYDFYNWRIPTPYGNGSVLAPFWDNLDPGKQYVSGGDTLLVGDGIYVWSDTAAHRFVVEWSRLANFRPYHGNRTDYDDLQTFELILADPAKSEPLTDDGIVRFQYKQVVNYDSDRMYATVGIESPDEETGLQYTYTNMYPGGAAPLSSGLAIDFTTIEPRYVPFSLKGFHAEADEGGVLLSWEPADERARGATIVYRESDGGTYFPVKNGYVPPGRRSFLDRAVKSDRRASYKIGSLDPMGHETLLGPFLYEGKDAPLLELALAAPGPNPFRGVTVLRYAVPAKARARLGIYTVSGRLVRTLLERAIAPGVRNVEWDGRDDEGRELPSGVYLGRLEVGAKNQSVKLTFIR